MPDESLRQLLKRADARPSVSDPNELVAGVRRRRIAQHRMRTTATVVGTVLAVSLSLVLTTQNPRKMAEIGPIEPVNVAQQMSRLRVDAQMHDLTARALEAKARARRAIARADAHPDPLAELQFQRDRAAMTLVYEANRFSQNAVQTERAIAQYRKVIELFPTSTWADVARQRLRDMQS